MHYPVRPSWGRRLAAPLFSLVLAVAPLRAALVAHDDFDAYTSGSALNGLSGGTGWTSAWTGVTDVSVSSEPLHYVLDTSLLGGGNALKIAANATVALDRAVTPASGGASRFVSFIFQVKGGTPGDSVTGNVFAGWQATDSAPDVANDSIGFLGASGKAGARVDNLSSSFATPLKYGQTYFFVVQYTGWNGSAYTSTRVWLNPTPAEQATTNASITQVRTETGGGSSGFLGLRARTLGLSSSLYYLVDELRVGESWSDVVSPPPGYVAGVHPNPELELVVFGDSLSSGGQSGTPSTGPAPTPSNGNYPRQTWIQQLSPMLGLGTLVNYYTPGGTNYAVGGDVTAQMVYQVDKYLTDVLAATNPRALLVLWCGGNDIGDTVAAVADGATIFNIVSRLAALDEEAEQAAEEAADRMEAQIRRLALTGGKTFVWANLPDLGKTPAVDAYVDTYAFGLSSVRSTIANALTHGTNVFNARMADAIDDLHAEFPLISIQLFDAHGLFDDVIANKAAYGFTNVTESSSTSNDYLFYDNVHPTSHGHYEIAQYAYAVVELALQRQDFATSVRQSLDHFDWAGWGAQGDTVNATTYTTTVLGSSSSVPRLGVHNVAGVEGAAGVLFAHTGSSSTASSRNDRFVVTADIDAVEVSAGRSAKLVWAQALTSTSSFVRVLVKVNGSWYSSAGQFGVTTASSSGGMTNAEAKSLDLAGTSGLGSTQWHAITFADGAPIVRSATPVSVSPGDTITGIGFLLYTGSATNRVVFVDDVELVVGGVP